MLWTISVDLGASSLRVNMDHGLEIIQEAMREGLDPGNLSEAQYVRLRSKIRSTRELVQDSGRAISSRVRTALGVRVPEEKARENEAVCRSNECKRFRLLVIEMRKSDGSAERSGVNPACDACNCVGRWLESKWSDPTESCPLGFWTNAQKTTGDFVSGS